MRIEAAPDADAATTEAAIMAKLAAVEARKPPKGWDGKIRFEKLDELRDPPAEVCAATQARARGR